MKLDIIKFARLVSYLGTIGVRDLDMHEIESLYNMIDVEVPEAPVAYPHTDDINTLMALMADGNRKIEAIKLHRKLTGWGLKESKYQVEKYWPKAGYTPPGYDHSLTTSKVSGAVGAEHTLSDILSQVGK